MSVTTYEEMRLVRCPGCGDLLESQHWDDLSEDYHCDCGVTFRVELTGRAWRWRWSESELVQQRPALGRPGAGLWRQEDRMRRFDSIDGMRAAGCICLTGPHGAWCETCPVHGDRRIWGEYEVAADLPDAHACASATTPDGHGGFCVTCGETLA